MIKIRITSPFRYQYVNDLDKKDIFFLAGDFYHLDAKKNKAEVKHVLSSNFPFKKYIHVELETVPQSIKKEVGLEGVSYEEYTLPIEEEYLTTTFADQKPVSEEEEGLPAQEPQPNRWDLTSQPFVLEEEQKEEEETGLVENPAMPEEDKLPEEAEDIEVDGEKEKNEREKDLEELHYSKIKDIAELYNIEYTNKREVIEKILEVEYGDADKEPERKLS